MVWLPSRGIPRRLLVLQFGGGRDRLLRAAWHVVSEPSSVGAVLPMERTVSAFVVVGVDEPSSGLFPDGRRVSPHVLSILD